VNGHYGSLLGVRVGFHVFLRYDLRFGGNLTDCAWFHPQGLSKLTHLRRPPLETHQCGNARSGLGPILTEGRCRESASILRCTCGCRWCNRQYGNASLSAVENSMLSIGEPLYRVFSLAKKKQLYQWLSKVSFHPTYEIAVGRRFGGDARLA
jgi:hypothetical protein